MKCTQDVSDPRGRMKPWRRGRETGNTATSCSKPVLQAAIDAKLEKAYHDIFLGRTVSTSKWATTWPTYPT